MFSFLQKPYPYIHFSRNTILTYFYVGAFIALFLIIFQPFEIYLWQTEHKTLKLIGFGVVSFICPPVFKWVTTLLLGNIWLDNWKVWKEITVIVSMLLFVALGNLLYARLIMIAQLDLQQFWMAILVTFTLGIFPVSFSVAFKYHKFLALNKKEAEEIEVEIKKRDEVKGKETVAEQSARKITLIAENNKDTVEMEADALLYIESVSNYCNLVSRQNNKDQKLIIRSSLKRIESQISQPDVVRCHRAFIVNLKNVAHIEGNAQGYRISFKGSGDTIPVSRQYRKTILELLQKFNTELKS